MRAALHAERSPNEARTAPPLGQEAAQLADGSQQAERHRPLRGLAPKTVQLTVVAGALPAGKRLFPPGCGSPAPAADGGAAERQGRSALGHKAACWEKR